MARVRSLALRTAALAALAALLDAALRALPPLPSALREWHRGGHYANYRGEAGRARVRARTHMHSTSRSDARARAYALHSSPRRCCVLPR